MWVHIRDPVRELVEVGLAQQDGARATKGSE